MLSPASDFERLRTSAALLDLSPWALIELRGDDRIAWLQGQVTNDLRQFEEGQSISFCLTEATGQILAVVDAWAMPGRILMTTAREQADAVLRRVEQMTILEDVEASISNLVGISIQGPDADYAGEGIVLRSDRTGFGGFDVWSPTPTLLDQPMLSEESYETARIAAGIPKWGVDMGTRTLPPELGPDFEARHVSYSKGCYMGQEVLMRMHSRGHTNKTWMGLISASPLEPGALVEFEGKEVGKVSSAGIYPTPPQGEGRDPFLKPSYAASATLRNEATSEGTKVLIRGVEAEVRRMPILRPN